MIATYLTHSQDCDFMVKCPSDTFDIKQVEKYVLQQSNSNETVRESCQSCQTEFHVKNAFQFTLGYALQNVIVARIL